MTYHVSGMLQTLVSGRNSNIMVLGNILTLCTVESPGDIQNIYYCLELIQRNSDSIGEVGLRTSEFVFFFNSLGDLPMGRS